MKYILIILLLCSFNANAVDPKDGCGVSHVTALKWSSNEYKIHFYCLNKDGAAELDFHYATLEEINTLFNEDISIWQYGIEERYDSNERRDSY